MPRDLDVHRIRRQIDVAGPDDGAAVEEDLREESDVPEWRERAGQFLRAQLQMPRLKEQVWSGPENGGQRS